MLYPLWIQSVEKYADRAPAQLLRRVADGNAPENFIFCLNKIDYLEKAGGQEAVREVRDDYRERIARNLGLNTAPEVMMISALNPEMGDFPALRNGLSQQKSDRDVTWSKQLATGRHGRSLLKWIRSKDLPGRIERLDRFVETLEAEILVRIGSCLTDRIVPRIEADPFLRNEVSSELLAARMQRWPILNLLHGSLGATSRAARFLLRLDSTARAGNAQSLVDRHLPMGDPDLVRTIETTFAWHVSSEPDLYGFYEKRKYWETPDAERAVTDLRRLLAETLDRQAMVVREHLSGNRGILAGLFRGLLTLGAVLWFPFVQPALNEYLAKGRIDSVAALVVEVLGVPHLLSAGTFLLLYFAFLWVVLRWRTQRQVDRLFSKWSARETEDSELGLRAQAGRWMRVFLEPVVEHRERLERLVRKTESLEERLKAETRE